MPLSSISVQFLINVQNETSCNPPFLSISINETNDCANNFRINRAHDIYLLAETDCQNSTIIQDIATISFANVIKKRIAQTEPSKLLIQLTWIPTIKQIGHQVLCAMAIDRYI